MIMKISLENDFQEDSGFRCTWKVISGCTVSTIGIDGNWFLWMLKILFLLLATQHIYLFVCENGYILKISIGELFIVCHLLLLSYCIAIVVLLGYRLHYFQNLWLCDILLFWGRNIKDYFKSKGITAQFYSSKAQMQFTYHFLG